MDHPDVLDAFYEWLKGRPIIECARFIRAGTRLFPNAIRIGGWSHTFGGIMKRLCTLIPEWPRRKEQWSQLCQFYRNRSWREHVEASVQGRYPSAHKKLHTFSAQLVKWRYETAADVCHQLTNLRTLSENFVVRELFVNTQEQVLIGEVIGCCNDQSLWRLTAALDSHVFGPLERMRHWGMVCNCERHRLDRHAGRKVHCWKAGRRLEEVPQFLADAEQELQTTIDSLTPARVGGCRQTYNVIVNLLRQAKGLLQTRLRYLTLLPWRFATADTVTGAQACLEQVRSTDLEAHDSLTQRIVREYMVELELVANGCPCPKRLWDLVLQIRTACLDESLGEGFHRGTTRELARAPGSTLRSLKRAVRIKHVLKLAKWLMRLYKHLGKNVIRHDWRTWSRLLQPLPSNKWVPKRINPSVAFARIYQEDGLAKQDWSLIVGRSNPERAVQTEAASEDKDEPLHREWLLATLACNTRYSVTDRAEVQAEDGSFAVEPRAQYFYFIGSGPWLESVSRRAILRDCS